MDQTQTPNSSYQSIGTQHPTETGQNHNRKFSRITHYLKSHWKELLLAIVVAIAATIMIYTLVFQSIFTPRRLLNVTGARDDTTYSPLSGLETTKELAARPVTGIIIENSPDARPQSGINQAGIVFEAVAEGGITRYLTLFQDTRPQIIGPVRSLRPYYLEWGMGFDAPIAHVGGSAPALFLVDAYGAKDLNQMHIGEAGFWRSSDRVAPHNVYTSFDRLDTVNKDRGYTTSTFTPYKRKKDKPLQTPTHTSIPVNYSGPLYAVEFRYNPTDNNYLRFLAGAPDIERESGQQIAVKNLVVLDMPTTYNGVYAEMPALGSGTGTAYIDGGAISITWEKKASRDQLKLINTTTGKELELNRGNTWFAIQPIR